jgi:hypothetical protein
MIARTMRGGSRRRVRAVGYEPEYRGRQAAPRHEPPVNPQMLRAELSVLADDVLRLEPQVALNDAARDDYEAATHRYRVAQAAMDQADDQLDYVRVQRVVDEAQYSMARARATLQGRAAPEPPPALQAPGSHGEPAIRLDDRRNPVYVGSPAPFRMGWFGAGTGLFGGLLLGLDAQRLRRLGLTAPPGDVGERVLACVEPEPGTLTPQLSPSSSAPMRAARLRLTVP